MKRLTRPAIKVDETVTKYLGQEIRLESINDRLLELILNGPTLMAVKKDVLRQLIRQLYGRLKAYEDIEMEPQDIEQTLMNFSSFLMEMTGGRMSKTNYTVQAMISEANDHFEGICDECRERAADVVEVLPELRKTVELLHNEYEKAKKLDFVYDPIAYAVYQVWKAVDGRRKNGR